MARQPETTLFGHGMLKRSFIAIVSIALLLGVIATASMLRTQTASAVDLQPGNCSITVNMPVETKTLPGGAADIVYDVYQVAVADPISGVDGYNFLQVEALEGSSIDWSAIGSPEFYNSLAQLACTFTPLNANVGENQLPLVDSSIDVGQSKTLSAGLYLIIAHSPNMTPEQYTKVSAEGAYTTIGTSPYYEFTFNPELVAVPSKVSSTGALTTMGPGEWNYNVTATLKPSEQLRNGSLQILKDLLSYESAHPADFVFQVDAYSDEARTNVVYSDVVGMHFDGAGQQSLLLEGKIPAGSYVTVTEVYSGASYTIVGEGTVNVGPIAADPIGGLQGDLTTVATVSFTNQYNDRDNHGGSIVNNFRYDNPPERSAQGVNDLQWIWTRE